MRTKSPVPAWDPDAPLGITGRELLTMLEAMGGVVQRHTPVRYAAIVAEWGRLECLNRALPTNQEELERAWDAKAKGD